MIGTKENKEYMTVSKEVYKGLIFTVINEYGFKYNEAKRYLMDKYNVKQGKQKVAVKRVKHFIKSISIDEYRNDRIKQSEIDLRDKIEKTVLYFFNPIEKNSYINIDISSSHKVFTRHNEYMNKLERLYCENIYHYMTLKYEKDYLHIR